MKTNYFILLFLSTFFLLSCVDDDSAYEVQEKENVLVDQVTDESNSEEEELPDGQLVPGFHTIKLNVKLPDNQTVERRFKYYMPVSIDNASPISLIFEFHGSYDFDKEVNPTNPLESINNSNALAQHAIRENCIICYPAGEVVYNEDNSGSVNWQNSENNLCFVDAILDYFKNCTPSIDKNRIFATGESSGAIFSFALALHRSETFAAIAPRAGQMSLSTETEMPARAVPIRLFAGEEDDVVLHSSALENLTTWAEKIGGYFTNDMQLDELTIDGYSDITIRKWTGANADIEMYSLSGIGHSISLSYCLPSMWDFMKSHTLDQTSQNLFLSTSVKSIESQCGEEFSFQINYTNGATVTMDKVPNGWNTTLEGKTVTLFGPNDYYADIDRNGEIQFTASLNGETVSTTVTCSLIAPKNYFEVGDIYYNEDFEPVGVVFWVNKANIREAKIICPETPDWGTIWYCGNDTGLGLDFDTPNMDDGAGNTQKMIDKNNTLEEPYPAGDAAFMWASTRNYKGVTGWYLPAVNELVALAPHLNKVNEALASFGGTQVSTSWGNLILYSSTTEVKSGDHTKTIYYYDYTLGEIGEKQAKNPGSEYFGYISVRAIKKVTK